MKKQMLAKLIVLGMVAAMLPIAAIAADDKETTDETKCELNCAVDSATEDDRPTRGEKSESTSTTAPATSVTVQTTTNASGQVVASTAVTATMSGSTATVTMSADALASLATQAANSDIIVLEVAASSSATEVVLNVPAAALVDLATKTGADLVVSSSVANITLSNADLLAIAGSATNVQVSAKVVDGKIQILVAADGKAVTDIPGGLVVAVPATEGASAFQVADDGTETEIEDAVFADGNLTLTLFSSATIRIG